MHRPHAEPGGDVGALGGGALVVHRGLGAPALGGLRRLDAIGPPIVNPIAASRAEPWPKLGDDGLGGAAYRGG